MANKGQSIFKSFLFHAALLVAVSVVGFLYPSNGWAYAIAAPFFLVGIIWSAILYKEDGEETIAPYVVSAIGTILFWILTASA